MQPRWHRSIGAALFSVLMTLVVFGRPALRGEGADLGAIVVSLLVAAAIAYRAWPALCVVWANRDRADDWRRVVWIGAGVLFGFALGDVVPALLGPHSYALALFPLGLTAALIVVLTITKAVRTRRG